MVFVVTRGYAEKSGQLLKRFTAAALGASKTLNGGTGRDEFIRVGREGPLKGEIADHAGSIYDYYRSIGLWPRGSEPFTEEQYDRTMDFLRQSGQLEVSVPFEDAWDLAYWKNR